MWSIVGKRVRFCTQVQPGNIQAWLERANALRTNFRATYKKWSEHGIKENGHHGVNSQANMANSSRNRTQWCSSFVLSNIVSSSLFPFLALQRIVRSIEAVNCGCFFDYAYKKVYPLHDHLCEERWGFHALHTLSFGDHHQKASSSTCSVHLISPIFCTVHVQRSKCEMERTIRRLHAVAALFE